MSGNPAEQLKNKAQEDAERKRQEHDRLMIWLEDCVEELNPEHQQRLAPGCHEGLFA